MEIAGKTCSLCGRRIVLTREGKACSACEIAVHQSCDTSNTCKRCGKEYEFAEAPVIDVARDATLPRNLRPSRSSDQALLLIALIVLLALLILTVRWIC